MNETPAPKVRSLFATKTALAQYLTTLAGLVAVFWPPATEWVQQHAVIIVFAVPALNLAVRAVTHGRVQLVGESSEL